MNDWPLPETRSCHTVQALVLTVDGASSDSSAALSGGSVQMSFSNPVEVTFLETTGGRMFSPEMSTVLLNEADEYVLSTWNTIFYTTTTWSSMTDYEDHEVGSRLELHILDYQGSQLATTQLEASAMQQLGYTKMSSTTQGSYLFNTITAHPHVFRLTDQLALVLWVYYGFEKPNQMSHDAGKIAACVHGTIVLARNSPGQGVQIEAPARLRLRPYPESQTSSLCEQSWYGGYTTDTEDLSNVRSWDHDFQIHDLGNWSYAITHLAFDAGSQPLRVVRRLDVFEYNETVTDEYGFFLSAVSHFQHADADAMANGQGWPTYSATNLGQEAAVRVHATLVGKEAMVTNRYTCEDDACTALVVYTSLVPVESCLWSGCPLLKAADVRHTPDLDLESGQMRTSIKWFSPANTIFDLGYYVCTLNKNASTFVEYDCGGCLSGSNGAVYLGAVAVTAASQVEVEYAVDGDVLGDILVCPYRAPESSSHLTDTAIPMPDAPNGIPVPGVAVTAPLLDAGPAECSLGVDCSVTIKGTYSVTGVSPVELRLIKWQGEDFPTNLSTVTDTYLREGCDRNAQVTAFGNQAANPIVGVCSGDDGCTFDLGILTSLTEGRVGMCIKLAQGYQSAQDNQASVTFTIATMRLNVGILSVYGPKESQASLAAATTTPGERGQALGFRLDGYYAPSLNVSRVMVFQQSCPTPQGALSNPIFGFPTELTQFTGLSRVYGVSTKSLAGANPDLYVWSDPVVGVQPGSYALCWCLEREPGDYCTSEANYVVETGFLLLIGPFTPTIEHICWRGRSCNMTEYGYTFQASDALHVCQNTSFESIYAWNQQVLSLDFQAKDVGFTTALTAHVNTPITAAPGQYTICWRSGRGVTLLVPETPQGADFANFKVLGPKTEIFPYSCKLGRPCVISIEITNLATQTEMDEIVLAIRDGNGWGDSEIVGPSAIMLKGPTSESVVDHLCEFLNEASSALRNNTLGDMDTIQVSADLMTANYNMRADFMGVEVGVEYALCWCMGYSRTCTDANEDFRAWAGTFFVGGPYSDPTFDRCSFGSRCAFTVTGVDLSAQMDYARVMTSCGVSGTAVPGFYPSIIVDESGQAQSDLCTGCTNPSAGQCLSQCDVQVGLADNPAINVGVGIIFQWSGATVSANPGMYEVCWCSQSTTHSCDDQTTFKVLTGYVVVGPRPTPQAYRCVTFQDCILQVPDADADFNNTLVRINSADTPCGATQGTLPLGIPTVAVTGRTDGGATVFIWSEFDASELVDSFGVDHLRLCWCGEVSGFCSEFNVDIGTLQIDGPAEFSASTNLAQHFQCVLGELCVIPGINGSTLSGASLGGSYTTIPSRTALPFEGTGVMDGDYLAIVPSGGCSLEPTASMFSQFPSTSDNIVARSLPAFANGQGFAWATSTLQNSWVDPATNAYYTSYFTQGLTPGTYSLCWCRGTCEEYWDFLDESAGQIEIVGPSPGQIKQCIMGRNCLLTLAGVQVAFGDHLMVLDFLATCGAPGVGSRGGAFAYSALADGTELSVLFLTNKSDTLHFTQAAGIYKICWCQPIYVGQSCVPRVQVGSVLMNGPFSSDESTVLGMSYVVQNVNGIGLSDTQDRMMLLVECGTNPTDGFLPIEADVRKTDSGGMEYDLGTLTHSTIRALQYRKCWCTPFSNIFCDTPSSFNTEFGKFTVLCPLGQEDVQNNGTCTECAVGFYKDSVNNPSCTKCVEDSTTQSRGKVSLDACICNPGFYWDIAQDLCVDCPMDQYCSGYGVDSDGTWFRQDPVDCPANAITQWPATDDGLRKESVLDCLCKEGYAPFPLSLDNGQGTFECQACDVGSFKAAPGNVACESCQDLITNSTTPNALNGGSTAASECNCIDGWYQLEQEGPVPLVCVVCPVSFFCAAGEKTRCPNGATTPSEESSLATECECDKGYKFTALTGACDLCEVGRYKETIGNGDTCPGECPVNSTSRQGARGLENCICQLLYENVAPAGSPLDCQLSPTGGIAHPGDETFQVPAVTGGLVISGSDVNIPTAPLDRLSQGTKIAQELAGLLGLSTSFSCTDTTQPDDPPNSLRLACGEIDLLLDFQALDGGTTNTSRRLQLSEEGVRDGLLRRRLQNSGSVGVQWTVRQSTPADAALAAQQWNPNELLTALLNADPANYGSNVSVLQPAAPSVAQVDTTCPDGKALPIGAPFVSVAISCQCQAGTQPDDVTGECVPCNFNTFKPSAGNDACTECNQNTGGNVIRKTTGTGKVQRSQCYCSAGLYQPNPFDFTCLPCPIGQYCPEETEQDSPDNDLAVDCPAGSLTKSPSSQIIDSCECIEGFGRVAGAGCILCPARTYKDTHKDDPCTDCPQAEMESLPGSTNRSQCSCEANFYYLYSRTGGEGECLTCATTDGLDCVGGFYPNSTDHILPVAQAGFFLTGNALAEPCEPDPQGGEICFGGRPPSVPCERDCDCKEGMDGFICQNCRTGWTRDAYTEICTPCSDTGVLWAEVAMINFNAILSSFFYHVLTMMAIKAAGGSRSLHSTLIRMGQSWALSMSVLRVFDFSNIEMFSWGAEAKRLASVGGQSAAGSNTTNGTAAVAADEEAVDTTIPFPPWFQDIAKKVFALNGLNVDIGTPTTVIECLAESLSGSPDSKYIATAVYFVTYPVVVLFWLLLIDVILVYGIFPPLERAGKFPPTEPTKLKEWTKNRMSPGLMQSLRDLGVEEFDLESVAALVHSAMRDFEMDLDNARLISDIPREGLAALEDLMSPECKRNATRAILFMSKPDVADAIKISLMNDANKDERKLTGIPVTGEEAVDCIEVWDAIDHCARCLGTNEEFLTMLKKTPRGDKEFFIAPLMACTGIEATALRLSFVNPFFLRVCKQQGIGDQAADHVWSSLRDALFVVAHTNMHDILSCLQESNHPLEALADLVETRVPGGATCLLVVMHQEPIVHYLHETNSDEHREDAWGLNSRVGLPGSLQQILSTNNFATTQPPHMVRIPAVELKVLFENGPKATIHEMARLAGTGPGGLLLLRLHTHKLMRYLRECMEELHAGEEIPPSALVEQWALMCHYAYTNDFDVIEGFIQEAGAHSKLLEAVVAAYSGGGEKGGAREKSAATQVSRKTVAGGVAAAGAGVAAPAIALATGAAVGGDFPGLDAGMGDFGTGAVGMLGAYEALMAVARNELATADYPVFGLFSKSPGFFRFLDDAQPIIYIALYSIWYETTRRLLLLVHCKAFVEEDASGTAMSKQRWMKQTEYECYTGSHFIITLISVCGLGSWSVGLLVYLGVQVWRNRKDMTIQKVQRRYCYFVSGYEIDRAYWDILVKKTDNLLTIVITYTDLASDKKAKLLCYAALAGCFLIIHNFYMPFDDRKNQLCDRIENLGLMVRFCTFALFEMLIIFNPAMWIAATFAGLVAIMGVLFMLSLVINIMCEFFADLSGKTSEVPRLDQMKWEKLRKMNESDKPVPRFTKTKQNIMGKVKKVQVCLQRYVLKLLFLVGRHFAVVQHDLEQETLCIMPGPNSMRYVVPRPKREHDNICLKIRRKIAIWFFYHSDEEQRNYIATVMGGIVSLFLCHHEVDQLDLGYGFFSWFLTICSALKEADMAKAIPPNSTSKQRAEVVMKFIVPAAELAAERGVNVTDLLDTTSKAVAFEGEDERYEIEQQILIRKLRLTGEDLNDGLMLLERLDKTMMDQLFHEARHQLNLVRERIMLDETMKDEGKKIQARSHRKQRKSRVTSKSTLFGNGNGNGNGDSRAQSFMAITSTPDASVVEDWKLKAMNVVGGNGFFKETSDTNTPPPAIEDVDKKASDTPRRMLV